MINGFRRLRSRLVLLATSLGAASILAVPGPAVAQRSALDAVRERGVVLVGTTGDYRPFSFLDPRTGEYEGFDIDAARHLGEALGVEVRFVATTWPSLIDGILEGRYDIAMSGITRTLARVGSVGLTDPYASLGKTALVRTADRDRFTSLAEIDRAGVTIGVNPGGTNEAFVRTTLHHATVVVIDRNLAIPDAIAAGDVDVMITDNVEAVLVARERPVLHAVSPDQPYTREDVGYMVRRDDQAFLNWLNLWLFQMRSTGALARLEARWLGR
jgi:cyclohexadienyl dehydratase